MTQVATTTRQVCCPGCQSVLRVPDELPGPKVRCGQCKAVFQVDSEEPPVVSDDVIAGWLTDWLTDRDDGAPTAGPLPADPFDGISADSGEWFLESAGLGAKARRPGPIRLLRIDSKAAELEFPADRLLYPEFRLAMPRRCMRCDGHSRLGAQVVVFAAQAGTPVDMIRERQKAGLSLNCQELARLEGEELLKRLAVVPGVPFPGNLPMPYYVCDRCSPEALVSGQIQPQRAGP